MIKNHRLSKHAPLIQEGPDLKQIQIIITFSTNPNVEIPEVIFTMPTMEVSGDIQQKNDSEMKKAFKRMIKRPGNQPDSSSLLKMRPFQKANDGEIKLPR